MHSSKRARLQATTTAQKEAMIADNIVQEEDEESIVVVDYGAATDAANTSAVTDEAFDSETELMGEMQRGLIDEESKSEDEWEELYELEDYKPDHDDFDYRRKDGKHDSAQSIPKEMKSNSSYRALDS